MSHRFFADDPILGKDADQLQRFAFARQVAKLCVQVGDQSETSVMALIGAWGSGKSSILSLVREELESGHQDWRLVNFNPWLFSDVESLLQSFFGALGEGLPRNKSAEARKKLGKYAETVAPLGKLASLVGIDASAMVSKLGAILQGDTSAESRRVELENELRKLGSKILVIIDDIDRLQPVELLSMFKLIRLAARLPNVYYLLAYDERTVVDVLMRSELAHESEERAHDYIEKIVQIRLDLPPLQEEQQAALFDKGLEQIMATFGVTLTDADSYRLSLCYHYYLNDYLTEPRAINRFLAQISALYPLVHTEVDFIDFVLLTFLRTFEPRIYTTILKYKAELVGQAISYALHKETNEQKKAHWSQILTENGVGVDKIESTLKFLTNLFLPVRSAVENMTYGSSYYDSLARAKRVGCSDYFDRYFQFGVPASDISDTTFLLAVSQMSTGEGPELHQVSEKMQNKPELVLRKIDTLLATSSVPDPLAVLRYLSGYYRDLLEDRGFLRAPDAFLRGIARRLAGLIAPDEVVQFVDEAIREGKLEFATDLALRGVSEEDKQPWLESVSNLLLTAYVDEMNRIGNLNLSTEVQGDDFSLIYRWVLVQPDKAVMREHLWACIKSGKWQLISLLGRLVGEATVYGSGPPRRTMGELDSGYLDQILGIGNVIAFLDKEYPEWEREVADKDEGGVLDDIRKQKCALRVIKNLKQRRKVAESDGDSDSSIG